MNGKQRLELDWIGKDEIVKLEPRILLEDSDKTFGSEDSINQIIHGDNLLALKSLEADFSGKVKCVYIDPPYNTGSAFGHYEDGLEHSQWLSMMKARLSCLHGLLSDDGTIWISIDDNEVAYLRILLDEIFGRKNFVATCIWQKVYSPKSSAKYLSVMHDYVICYAKNMSRFERQLLPRTEKQNKLYKNMDNDPRGPWKAENITARNPYSLGKYEVECPGGRKISGPPQGRYWVISKEKLNELDRDNRIWWGKEGNNVPAVKKFLHDIQKGVVPQHFGSTTKWGTIKRQSST